MSAQATRVNQLVTAALGLDVEQARWRALTRQISPSDPLPNRLRSIGSAVDVGYLDRKISGDTLKLAIAERTVPIVLIDLRNDDAIVLCRNADDRVHAVLVPAAFL